jgi:hypothetical protein
MVAASLGSRSLPPPGGTSSEARAPTSIRRPTKASHTSHRGDVGMRPLATAVAGHGRLVFSRRSHSSQDLRRRRPPAMGSGCVSKLFTVTRAAGGYIRAFSCQKWICPHAFMDVSARFSIARRRARGLALQCAAVSRRSSDPHRFDRPGARIFATDRNAAVSGQQGGGQRCGLHCRCRSRPKFYDRAVSKGAVLA